MDAELEGSAAFVLSVKELKKWIERHPGAEWIAVEASFNIDAPIRIQLRDEEHRALAEIEDDD